MIECALHMHVSDCDCPEFWDENVRPEKFQFLEKGQNRNFDYKIVISVKNPKFILYISDEEMDCIFGIVSRNLAST